MLSAPAKNHPAFLDLELDCGGMPPLLLFLGILFLGELDPSVHSPYEATFSAMRFNYGIKNIYPRLKERGRYDRVAWIVAVRKLLLIACAIHKGRKKHRAPRD